MQGVRLYSKKVSYDNDAHGPLDYASARALFLSSQSMLLNAQAHSRAFILARWHLGKYFYEMRHIWSDKSKGCEWLKRFWPEVNRTYIRFWVQFYLSYNKEDLGGMSPETLRASFVENMSLNEDELYAISPPSTANEKTDIPFSLKQVFSRVIRFFSLRKAQ